MMTMMMRPRVLYTHNVQVLSCPTRVHAQGRMPWTTCFAPYPIINSIYFVHVYQTPSQPVSDTHFRASRDATSCAQSTRNCGLMAHKEIHFWGGWVVQLVCSMQHVSTLIVSHICDKHNGDKDKLTLWSFPIFYV